MNPSAEALAAILFHGLHCPPDAAPAMAMRDLHALLKDDALLLEVHGWADEGGPDGEQFYCAADLVARRLSARPGIGLPVLAILSRDDAAVSSLLELARHFDREGHSGAAGACRTAVAVLRPAPRARGSLSPAPQNQQL